MKPHVNSEPDTVVELKKSACPSHQHRDRGKAHEIAQALETLQIYGDIIPISWFHILTEPGKSKKAQDYLNVVVLAHIVSYFRPIMRRVDGKQVMQLRFQGPRLFPLSPFLWSQY